MSKITALLLAALSGHATANVQWDLVTDSHLDGVLATSGTQLQQLTVQMHANKFNATDAQAPEASLIQGEFEHPKTFEIGSGLKQRVQFSLAKDGARFYFLGQGSEQDGYQGTWYGPNNDSGDFTLTTQTAIEVLPASCAQILNENPDAQSGVYNIDPDGSGSHPGFDAYCDMDTDEGGWTLIGTYSKSEPGGKKYISEYNPQPDVTAISPTVTGLYQGPLSAFRDVREQVSCDYASCRTVYQSSMSQAELEMVRYTWGYEDQQAHQKDTPLPSCRTAYVTNEEPIEHCLYVKDGQNRNNTNVVGWQRDVHPGYSACWLAHGVYSPDSLGSPRCSGTLKGNATRWGLLWAR
ncbi:MULTISPECIES: fibrinogen-like YCDxxxxGGGW domain-containing protein [unclassified Pseudoalteromonas]|uniref:fibrinogen-like YCDxxxxGGGW domain-containing protein n=1 Tax=unclassified Pseudoalteromonas TaxID=194690 RepID=UPI002096BD3A|nr:fibrinogen-like YCDxxxxGGGW domain-containing protein [Pseudoalteromonas sp. XMcav2-N]MCO7190934.1 fibrinogen-like YCDxxxxGGGW domain-containing protein [Pseudoalteromonas sp. XMcav2-N]